MVDLGGSLITKTKQAMSVSLEQPYGDGFYRTETVPVKNGFFEASLYRTSDDRHFTAKVKLQASSEYLNTE